MRVTQVMLGRGLGGAERYFVDLAVALAERDVPVQAICHERFPGLPALRSCSALETTTVRTWGRIDALARAAVRKAIAGFGPDVVQAHLARGAAIGGAAARTLGIPVVAKTHNYVKLKYYRDVDLLVPTTRDQARYLESKGIPRTRIERIPNFSSQPPMSEPFPDERPVRFASYGRMVGKKGFGDLLLAFRQIIDAGVDAHLALGGDGPERASLEAMAHDLGLAGRVRMPGWIDDPASFLAAAHVFVLPSRLEPFGIVVLEAMAAGRPIVSTRSEGPAEVLDESTAYLVPIADPSALAQAMRTAAASPAERALKAARATERFRREYHRDAVLPRVLASYERVVRDGPYRSRPTSP